MVADVAKLTDMHGPALVDLALAPLHERVPNMLVSGLANDRWNCIGIAPEVPGDCFIAEMFNIKVAVLYSTVNVHMLEDNIL